MQRIYSRAVRISANGVLSLLLSFLVVGAVFFSAHAQALPPNFQLETVVPGLNQPVYLTELPDSRMLVATKSGQIRIFDPNLP
ncbi:hypothetical protein [Marinobacter changyiensis]|uniref:hypothetical protein n=1 Tax=Marinobacter changyiensis TaxID=2604091 RepID=UPI00126443FC|nr:hypothetical protein [Marinobacter changyiensis]